MQPDVRFVRLPSGVRLEYAEQGSPAGLPVVMLHGITDSWRSFETVMHHLPASLNVFALSQRGHGESDRPQSYRTREFAADAASFIETMGLRRALVVGHSMGSANAMRLAIDRPDLVHGLVLAGAFASFGANAGLAQFHRDAIVPLGDPIERPFIEEWQRSTLARPIDPAYFDTIVRETMKVQAAVWHGAFGALFDDEQAAGMERIQAPTLLAWGELDAFAPRADQDTIAGRVRGARLAVYAGAGHALHWEQPARFAADVAAFAQEIAQPMLQPMAAAR
jgi:non-heme chloroperoxidase